MGEPTFQPAPRPRPRILREKARQLAEATGDLNSTRPSSAPEPRIATPTEIAGETLAHDDRSSLPLS